jgi:hypothetical protein
MKKEGYSDFSSSGGLVSFSFLGRRSNHLLLSSFFGGEGRLSLSPALSFIFSGIGGGRFLTSPPLFKE